MWPLGFLDIFYLPLRKRVAAAQFEEAKLQVTGAVLDFAADGPGSVLSPPGQRADARAAADDWPGARDRVRGGAAPPCGREHHRPRPGAGAGAAEEAKLQLRAAEIAARESREQLNTLMGLWGQETAWHIDRRLPDLPEEPLPFDGAGDAGAAAES